MHTAMASIMHKVRVKFRDMIKVMVAVGISVRQSGWLWFRNRDRRRTKTGTNHNPDPNRYRIRCPDPIARIHEALTAGRCKRGSRFLNSSFNKIKIK